MIDRINKGDKEALKALLSSYTRPVYERALMRTGDESAAKTVARTTLNEIMAVASRGQCPENADDWIMELAERFSADEMRARDSASAPVQAAPVQAAPVQAAPVQAAPVQTAPVQAAPVQAAPLQAAPTPVQQHTQPQESPIWAPPDFNAEWAPPDYITGWTPDEAQAQRPSPKAQAEPVAYKGAEQLKEDFVSPRSEAARSRKPGYYDDEDDELDLFDEEDDEEYSGRRRKKKAGFGMVLLILLLGALVVALVWMLAVMLMSRGILPMADLGFAEWFNTNLFPLY